MDNASESGKTIPDLLRANAAKRGGKVAYREKEFGIWQSWTWKQAQEEVTALALGLLALGIKKGDHLAIIDRNRPAHYWTMIAAQTIGAIPVPVYQEAVAEEMEYVLEHCEVKYLVAGDQEQVDKILEMKELPKKIKRIIYKDPRGLRKYDHSKLISMKNLQKAGRESAGDLQPELDRRLSGVKPEDTCVMLYTSGTTGNPKGVVLTHRNIIEASRISSEFEGLTEDESILAYLPMAWGGDFIFSVGQALWNGFTVCCPESEHTMQNDLREIGPNYFFAPPRYFEGLLTHVMVKMEDAGRVKQAMFKYFMDHAKAVGTDLMDGKSVPLMDRIKYAIGNLLVYGPLKNQMGLSKVQLGYTAGEALGPEIFDFYRCLGVNLKQLYGQTEAGILITIQPDGEIYPDTVGVAPDEVEVKVTKEGEVLYRSNCTFKEYFKNPASTKDTKDSEGWVKSGDAGFFDPETKHLQIIDRIKDVGKLKDGSMFAPKYVENKLKFYPNILEAVMFGDGKDRCNCIINIDLASVGNWAERNNIAYASYQELAGRPEVYKMVQEHVEEVNRDLAKNERLSGCQIHKFLILHKELDADDGELTRTRKVRRRIVEQKYKDLISALYGKVESVQTTTEVTYEDGTKGAISATLEIRPAATYERAREAQAA